MFVFLTVNVAVQIGERASYSDVTRISSMLPGSPPLWLTRSGSEYFVNGAQVKTSLKSFFLQDIQQHKKKYYILGLD